MYNCEYESTFETSLDDFETFEEHHCIWYHNRMEPYGPMAQPESWDLVSVDGMGESECPKDLWSAALRSDEDRKPLDWGVDDGSF